MDQGDYNKLTLIFSDQYPGRHIHMYSNPHKVEKAYSQNFQIIKSKI